MPAYTVFGDCFSSDIPLPELRPSTHDVARWTLRVGDAPASPNGAELLGTDPVMTGVDVRLYRAAHGYRLVYDDTGTFQISHDGREIVWFKGPNPWLGAVRLDVINRVLPVALHASGVFCLHGSAVCIGGGAVAFLAPRGYGKSTLAIALTEFEGRILTDDALALELCSPVKASPGLHSVRLMDDAARAVLGDAGSLEKVGAYPLERRDLQQLPQNEPVVTKQIIGRLPATKLMFDSVPLTAVYILAPTQPAIDRPLAHRIELSGVRAALSLVEHAKSGALLGKSEAAVLFDRAVRLAQHVPVYRLEVARDLSRVREAAEAIAGWHQPAMVDA